MNRFPAHYHERTEQPLHCHACEQPLTDDESEHYWTSHLLGQGDPYCFDCASQIDLSMEDGGPNPNRKPSWNICSTLLFAASIGFLGLAACDRVFGGYYLMGAVACGSLGLLARICRW